MKFINFTIFISCISVIALALWSYIGVTRHKAMKFILGLVISGISMAILVSYGILFPDLKGSPWLAPFHGAALASLSWVFTLFWTLPFLLFGAIGCAIYRWQKRKKNDSTPSIPDDGGDKTMSRRAFLKGAAVAIPTAALATSAVGNVVGEEYLATTTHDLYYPDLPDYLDGYRIGQLSDTHMGLFFSPENLQESLDAAAAQHVNRLELTGDLIDELSRLPEYQEILRKNADRFPDGIEFCYGNHEYYRGLPEITVMLEKTPVRILRNNNFCASPGEGRNLKDRKGRDKRPFYIAATDYSFAKGDEAFQAEREDFVKQALDGIPKDAFVVLLAHHSAFIDEAFAHHIPLTLCGHTHGGQVALIGPIVETVGFKYLRGMYRHGHSYGYVNRGTGHWLPFRMLCSREVSVFTLHKQ